MAEIARRWFLVQQRVERDHWWYRGRRRLLERLLPSLLPERVAPGARRPRILDLGCGCGVNAELLARHGLPVLVDHSADALELVRVRAPRCQGDALRLPFAAGSFDLAVVLDLLEHLDDDRRGLAEVARVLRPGGRLLVMVPAFELLWGPQDDSSHHRRRYRRHDLLARAREAGLVVRRAWFFNFLLFLPILVARKLIRLLRLPVENENEVNAPALNAVLARLFAAESRLSPAVGFPFGVSLGLVAEKPHAG